MVRHIIQSPVNLSALLTFVFRSQLLTQCGLVLQVRLIGDATFVSASMRLCAVDKVSESVARFLGWDAPISARAFALQLRALAVQRSKGPHLLPLEDPMSEEPTESNSTSRDAALTLYKRSCPDHSSDGCILTCKRCH